MKRKEKVIWVWRDVDQTFCSKAEPKMTQRAGGLAYLWARGAYSFDEEPLYHLVSARKKPRRVRVIVEDFEG